jgi:hypothetical protein
VHIDRRSSPAGACPLGAGLAIAKRLGAARKLGHTAVSTVNTEAEILLASIRQDHEQRMLAFFRHHEAEAAIEMVRGLDTAMLVSWFIPAAQRDAKGNEFTRNMLFGARATVGPLLSKLKGLRAVPWIPSHSDRASHVDRVLARSGEIAVLQRLMALERYGLATSRFRAHNHIELFVSRDHAEDEEREALRELLDSKQPLERDSEFDERHREVTRRIERYARIWRD